MIPPVHTGGFEPSLDGFSGRSLCQVGVRVRGAGDESRTRLELYTKQLHPWMLRQQGATEEIRTPTSLGLNQLPLPLGYGGLLQVGVDYDLGIAM